MSDDFTEKFYAEEWHPDPHFSGGRRSPLCDTYSEARSWGEGANWGAGNGGFLDAFTVGKVFIYHA